MNTNKNINSLNMIKTRGWTKQEMILLSIALFITMLVILYPIISSGQIKSGRGNQSYDVYSRKWNVTPFLAIWGWIMILVILFFPIFYFRYHQTNITFKPNWYFVAGIIVLVILVFVFLGGFVWSDPIEHFSTSDSKPIVWFGLANTNINGDIDQDEYEGSNGQNYSYNQTYVQALIKLLSNLKEGNLKSFNTTNQDQLNTLIKIVQESNRDRFPLLIPGNLTTGNTTGARTSQWNQWSQFKQLFIDNQVLNNIFQVYETLGPSDQETPNQFLQNDNAGLTWLNSRNKRRYQTILTDENGNYLSINKQNSTPLYLVVINGGLENNNLDFLRQAVNAIGDNWFLISCHNPFISSTQNTVKEILQGKTKFLGCYFGNEVLDSSTFTLYKKFLNYSSPITNNKQQSVTLFIKPTAGTDTQIQSFNIKWPLEPWAPEPTQETPFVVTLAEAPTCTSVKNAVQNSPFKFTSIDPDTKEVYISYNNQVEWRVIKQGNNRITQKLVNNSWTTPTETTETTNCSEEVEIYTIPETLTGPSTCNNYLDILFAKNPPLFYTDSPYEMKIRANKSDNDFIQFVKSTDNNKKPVVIVTKSNGNIYTETECKREITAVRPAQTPPFQFSFSIIPETLGKTRKFFEIKRNINTTTKDTSLTAIATRLAGTTTPTPPFWSTAADPDKFSKFPDVIRAEDIAIATSEDAAKNLLSKYIQLFFVKFEGNNPKQKVDLKDQFPDVIDRVDVNIDFNFSSQSLDVPPYIITFKPGSTSELSKKWLDKWYKNTTTWNGVKTNVDKVFKLVEKPKTDEVKEVPLANFI